MKIYAKQINPAYQESPLFYDDMFPEDIAVCGNREYIEHCPEVFNRVYSVLSDGELADVLGNKNGWKNWYKNITEAITDYLPPEKEKYSTKDIGALKRLVLQYAECKSREEDSILCAVLSIVTGRKWGYRMITGCVQGEWNYIYYLVDEWTKAALEAFEAEYFNTGSEWIIDEGDFNPDEDNPEEISGYSIYCTSWNGDGIKQEIADSEGVDIDDVILFPFE